MLRKPFYIIVCLLMPCMLMSACAALHKSADDADLKLTRIDQIDSFKPGPACRQALAVTNNNAYSQDFFDSVFARIVEQCSSSKSPEDADIIWKEFVTPLKASGKVPPDLAVTTWNYYFSVDFASLPDKSTLTENCNRLSEIKKNIEKEYRLKIKGFEITQQGNPDAYFVNAMYVFNTMWAICHGSK